MTALNTIKEELSWPEIRELVDPLLVLEFLSTHTIIIS